MNFARIQHKNSTPAVMLEKQKRISFEELTPEHAQCSVHGGYETFKHKQTGEVMECPYCIQEREQAAEKQKNEQRRIDDILSRIDGLPERYRDAGFKNYAVSKQSEAAYKAVLAFAREPKNTWLLLLGSNGTGKTHLAHAVLKITGGIYREFEDMSNEFLDTQKDGGLTRLTHYYAYTPLLVIDEIDKVRSTEGRIGWLNTILRKRYNELLPVILIGNIDIDTLCKHIELNSGFTLQDRMKEVGQAVLCNWESYRPKMRSV